jgi:phosphoserine phosphatase RsbU/P
MPSQIPIASEFKTRFLRLLRPATKWGRFTLGLGALSLLLWVSELFGARVGGWAALTTIVFAFFGLLMLVRVGYRPMMWRLRNRLIVTYLFIGVMPILLLLVMGAIATFLFGGQFATYVAISDLNSELLHLQAANDALTAQVIPLERNGKLTESLAGELTRASDERFPRRTVTIWRGEEGFVLSTGGEPLDVRPARLPPFISKDFTGFIVDRNELHLRAVKLQRIGERLLGVVSDIPITPELLQPTAARLGALTLLPLSDSDNHDHGQDHAQVDAGIVPPRSRWFDLGLRFGTLFDVVDWQTGSKQAGGIGVVTRPSMLYATLFATLGERYLVWRDVLFAIVLFFGIIEIVALYIGVRLARSMTASVAELYSATEHMNRGDLSYRVKLQGRDQMAALGLSFNSMTESLAKLIDEQKEKQRLENELSIAYEVQELLFPKVTTDMPILEVHGLCIPARTVSGDYYDFIPLGADRLVLAVGDISGKGISAALLMATVHAFVRAYSVEPEMVLTPATGLYGSQSNSSIYGDDPQGQVAPAALMTTLNYQLFRSTPAAKYATLFLACYDARSRVMTYCNAGHLPPLILRATGEVVRLQVNGTVVGLFNGVAYDESTLVLQPNDIFIAYSDGVTEPENEFGEFGEDRLVDLIREHRRKPLPRIAEIVAGAVSDWIGEAEQPDDITVVLARCTSLPTS